MSNLFDPYHRWLGIPPDKQPASHYVLLALEPFEDDPDVIAEAADRQMVHLRSHQAGEHSALSQQLLNEVSAARVCLLNPRKKAEYDRQLRATLEAKREAIPRAVPLESTSRNEPGDGKCPVFLEKTGSEVDFAKAELARNRRQTQVAAGVVIVVVGLIAVAGLILWVAGSSAETKLTLEWPPSERTNAAAQIDGDRYEIGPSDDLRFLLEPGEHYIAAFRAGYVPFEEEISLPKGTTLVLRPKWRKLPESTGATTPRSAKPSDRQELPKSEPRVAKLPPGGTEDLALVPVRQSGRMFVATPTRSQGLKKTPSGGDGPFVEEVVAGRPAWRNLDLYLYFNVDNGTVFDGNEVIEVVIDYLDTGPGGFRVQYDSCDPTFEGIAQHFRGGPSQRIEETGQWKTARFVLPYARLADRCNGADFRVVSWKAGIVLSQVSVRLMTQAEFNPMAIRLGPWYKTDPLPASQFDEPKFPEIDGVDIQVADTKNKPRWTEVVNAADGVGHLWEGENASTYLYRIIEAKEPMVLPAQFGSDDALIVWINGEKILATDVHRGLDANQESAELSLNTGTNELLLRIHNYGGGGGYYFWANLPDARPRVAEPSTSRQESTVTEPAVADAASLAEKRLPVPSAEEQGPVARQLEEILHLSKIRQPLEKLKAAKELVELAGRPNATPLEKYVMFKRAMELATQGRDAEVAFEVADALGAGFHIDVLTLKGQLLRDLAGEANSSREKQALLLAARGYADAAIANRRYDDALATAKLIHDACKGSLNRTLRVEAIALRDRIQCIVDEEQRLDRALARIKEDPADGSAHLEAGQSYCFSKNDWNAGLPHLAKGSDAKMATVAAADDASAIDGTAPVQLGDMWWDLAQTRHDVERDAMLVRAAYWYGKALPGLGGLVKVKAERRMAEVLKKDHLAARLKELETDRPARTGIPVKESSKTHLRTKDAREDLSATATSGEADMARWVLNLGGRITVTVNGETDLDVSSIGALPTKPLRLRGVRLAGYEGRLDAEQLERLAVLHELRVLDLHGLALTDSHVGWLAKLESLHVLWLNNTKITDDALVFVAELGSLRRLHLESTAVTDNGLVHLAGLSNLEELRLEGTQVTDAGLTHLTGLPRLHWLGLSGPRITDVGLASLAKLQNLEILGLNGTAVTDGGLVHLGNLRKLRTLDVKNTQVTQAGIDRLKQSVPLKNIGR